MKKVIYIIVFIACIAVSFLFGKCTVKPSHNEDALLAYEHYYEVTEYMLENCEINDSVVLEHYNFIKSQIDSIMHNYVLHWPQIVDQRDQLSDVIRVTKDNHPEIADEIDNYLRVYYEDPNVICNWCYSY